MDVRVGPKRKGWKPKNWCFWIVELEKTLESPLDFKEIQSVHPKRAQPWVFFGRNDAKAETPVLWPPHVKSWLIGKYSDAARDWGQEEKGMTEDEMAGLHHWLDARESEWTPGVGDGQGGLACCDSWGRQELDMTERLKWTDAGSWLLCGLFSSVTLLSSSLISVLLFSCYYFLYLLSFPILALNLMLVHYFSILSNAFI